MKWIFFFFPTLLFADSLNTFITLALENNLELKGQRLSLLKEEMGFKKAKKGEYYPELEMGFSTSKSWIEEQEEKTTSKQKPSLDITASIKRPHPLGGRIKISPKWTENLSNNNDKWEIGIELDEPLSIYQRRKIKDPLFSEKKNLEITKLGIDARIAEIIYDVISSYLEIQRINLSIITKKEEISDLKENLEIARLKADKGIIPEIDVVQLELEELSLKTEFEQLEKEKKEKLLRFYNLLGTETRDLGFGVWDLEIKERIEGLKTKIGDKQMLLSCLEETEDVRIKKIEIELAKRAIKETREKNMPVIVPQWTMSKEKGKEEKKLGVSIKFPLYDQGIKKEDVKIAKASLKQKEIELQNLLNTNKIELETILNDIANCEKKLIVQEKEITLSDQIYEIARIKHQRGLISSKDLIDYQRDVFNKKKALFEAEIDLYLLYIKILKTTGRLYDAYKENIF